MPSLEIQTWLARLYTEESLLKQFLADRITFTRGMPPEAVAFFQALDGSQLSHFASSLRSKRAREASRMTPLLLHLSGSDYWRYFARFAEGTVSVGSHKSVSDALAFCEFLAECRELGDDIREAAHYERLKLGLSMKLKRVDSTRFRAVPRRSPVVLLKRFSWSLPCLTGPEDSLERRTTWTLFSNLPALTGVWYW